MKKILFINSSLSNGGAERVMTMLANEFNKRNYNVEMLIQNRRTQEVYKLDDGIKRIYFDSCNATGIKYTLKWLKKIRKTINKGDHDAIISFMMANNVLTLLANIGLKNKIIVSERCDPRRIEDYGRIFKWGEQLLYPRAKYIVVQTPDVKEYYKKSIKKKSVVIPNPINPESVICENGAPQRKVFTSVGRLSNQKNFPMLIEAFSLFSKKFDDYELEIYGQGSLLEDLKKLCSELEVEKKVHFKGYVDNVYEYMRTSTAFVLASNYEGISNAMIEALSMGVPTICTDCPVGGARLMIKPEVNGILVPVGDVKALAHAMIKVVTEPKFAQRLGKEALSVNEEYCVEKIADKWEEIILS